MGWSCINVTCCQGKEATSLPQAPGHLCTELALLFLQLLTDLLQGHLSPLHLPLVEASQVVPAENKEGAGIVEGQQE